MRVLILTWACDLEDISEPEISARWVREISKDHEVTVIAVSKPSRYGCVRRQFPHLEVIEWKDIWMPASLDRFRAIVKPGYVPYYFKARRFLKRFLKQRQFDVIHHLSPFAWRYPSPAVGLGVPVVRGPVAGGLKTPVSLLSETKGRALPFMFLRGTDQWRMKWDPILRSSYRETEHLLMAAPYMRDFLSALPLGSNSIEIEHGISELPKKISRGGISQTGEVIRLLYVGRVIPTKGLRLAIRALGQTKTLPCLSFTVVGDGEDLSSCRAEVERLHLQDRVRFLGWCPKAEVQEHYNNADILVFPSFREPTGGVLLEAMAHGVAIVTCAHGGPDYMVSDECGIKVQPSSEERFVADIAGAIDRLASDGQLRCRMGAAATARAEEHFGWAAKRKRISALYADVVA